MNKQAVSKLQFLRAALKASFRHHLTERNYMFEYKPQGICSTKITFDISGGKIHALAFKNGCEGNLNGISKLAEGMDARKLASLFKGTKCGRRRTSCPDQLSIAIEQALAELPG
jgi:uncharacterized protein (TIGR03905 family)